ncbi:WbqC family protein [Granulicoccus sp. GXG6511]|uniref:WbqC family protein n=1 Tax=Granulicoccus sp. GXG6511 TaxID=3381351 RepID=UPI003D7C39D4
MRVAVHQPDLLPYSGFWFKMAQSDKFVLAVHDQFQKHGYQRRVKMRDSWVSHQLVGKPSLVPISAVEVQPGWQDRLISAIRGRYVGAKHWKSRGEQLLEAIASCAGESLVDVNVSLIEVVRPLLDITTPLVITEPPKEKGRERVIEQCVMVGATSYLSGTGAVAYMGDDAEDRFAAAGLALEWSDHKMSTGDSIVSVLLDSDDPAADVRRAASDDDR